MTGTEFSDNVPRLIVAESQHVARTVLPLFATTTVGRDPSCTFRLDDPAVSRTHAVLERSGDETLLRDLGSTNGTSVNGSRLALTAARLRDGDLISFGGLEARFCAPAPHDRTQQVPLVSERPPPSSEWRIEAQTADMLQNVGRDQFNFFSQQRESFLREIAAAKTKARRLIWIGLAIFCVGLVVAVVGWTSAKNGIMSPETGIMSADEVDPSAAFADFDAGFTVFAVGGAIYAMGGIVMIIGVVLHIVAAARRRRGEAHFTPAGRPGHVGF